MNTKTGTEKETTHTKLRCNVVKYHLTLSFCGSLIYIICGLAIFYNFQQLNIGIAAVWFFSFWILTTQHYIFYLSQHTGTCAWWRCDNMSGTFEESSKYIMLHNVGFSGLCQRKRIHYIVIKQLVTVHCSFLYFELAYTITWYKSLYKCWTLRDKKTETWLLLVCQ